MKISVLYFKIKTDAVYNSVKNGVFGGVVHAINNDIQKANNICSWHTSKVFC
jgi:hypothetical protein